jgi:hypothetical protein
MLFVDDKNMRILLLISLISFFAQPSFAEESDRMRRFLVACGYGTLIGAAVGAASLAFTDDPGSKTMNIAKGASLGLYGGIGVGLYLSSQSQASENLGILPVFSPLLKGGKVDGAQISVIGFRF